MPPGGPPPAPPVPVPAGPSPLAPLIKAWKRLSPGEQLIAIGAALILVVADWLLSRLGANNLIGFGGIPIWFELPAAQLLVMVLFRAYKPGVPWPVSYGLILTALVVVDTAPMISDLLSLLRNLNGFLNAGLMPQLIELCLWVGTGLYVAGTALYWRTHAE